MYPLKYKEQIIKYANLNNLSPELVAGIIKTESSFKKNVVSNKGAVGLMQLMPSTAEYVCLNNNIEFSVIRLKEPDCNIKLGCLYLSYLIKKFEVIDTAIVAYNAGEGTVSMWLKNNKYSTNNKELNIIPYKESANYLKRVKNNQKIYKLRFNT